MGKNPLKGTKTLTVSGILDDLLNTSFIMKIVITSPFMFIFFIGIIQRENSNFVKIMIYTSYLFMMLVVEFTQINIFFKSKNEIISLSDFESCFVLFNMIGLGFYGMIYCVNFIRILPIPLSKTEKVDDIKNRIKDQSDIFISKVDEVQAHPIVTIVTGVTSAGLVLLNFKLKICDYNTALSILLALFIIMSYEIPNFKTRSLQF